MIRGQSLPAIQRGKGRNRLEHISGPHRAVCGHNSGSVYLFHAFAVDDLDLVEIP